MPKNLSKSLLGPYECKLSNGFTPWDVVQRQSAAVVLLVIEKNWFTGVFALFNSTDAPLYCNNDLVSSQNALSTEVFIFIWFLANLATKFHISVIEWARKCHIALKRYVMPFF
jgi:hypothetical protein